MKRVFLALCLVMLIAASGWTQVATVVGQVIPQQLNPATTTTSQAGSVTNPASNFIINISPGPVVCTGTGATYWLNQSQMTLAASQTYMLVYNCVQDTVYAKQAVTGPGSSGTSAGVPNSVLFPIPGVELNLATVVCGTTNCGNTANGTITDNRVAGNFPIVSDWMFWVPESSCGGATTGTAGSGNATDILATSGGARVFRVSATNAGSSANTFTCAFNVPFTKLTAGHGVVINDVTFLVSTQTTQPTSVTLPTFKSFTPPAPVDPETANSATFVAAGGTITQAPTSTQFAAYTPVSAGQFFTIKASLGTPAAVNTDLQTFQFVIVFNQSASAASLQEVPGFYVHGSTILN